MLFYLLYRLAWVVANIFPIRVAYWIAERCSDIQYTLTKEDREAVAENLRIILKKDIDTCRIEARKVFRNFGLYLVDFFRMSNIDKKWIQKNVTVSGIENIDTALKKGKGMICISCHIGNWEMGGVVIAMLGYDISAVALNHADKRINNFFIKQRGGKGFKVIPIDSTMKRCISVLRRNGLLALLGDRDFTGSGIIVDFFGMPTNIPRGPALLSFKTGAIIVPAFLVRDKRFKYKFSFGNPICPEECAGKDENEIIIKITQKFVRVMEGRIKMHPEQWLVFRRFWETPVDAFIL